jgi:hypothetical protein
MNTERKSFPILFLQWSLGIVILLESFHFAISPAAAREIAGFGLPPWIRPALGVSEIFAALLFLVPGATLAGGYPLLFVFAVAGAIHLLHGAFDVGGLIIYGMAVNVCMVYRGKGHPGGAE